MNGRIRHCSFHLNKISFKKLSSKKSQYDDVRILFVTIIKIRRLLRKLCKKKPLNFIWQKRLIWHLLSKPYLVVWFQAKKSNFLSLFFLFFALFVCRSPAILFNLFGNNLRYKDARKRECQWPKVDVLTEIQQGVYFDKKCCIRWSLVKQIREIIWGNPDI